MGLTYLIELYKWVVINTWHISLIPMDKKKNSIGLFLSYKKQKKLWGNCDHIWDYKTIILWFINENSYAWKREGKKKMK